VGRTSGDVYLWRITGVLGLLAVSFVLDLWGEQKEMRRNPLVASRFYSQDSVRRPMTEPLIKKEGETYRCNDCHLHLDASVVQKSFFSAHEDIALNHGANNYCLTCHSRNSKEFLRDINGQDIPFNKSELSCLGCHGTVYRDWENGAHGRMNGYWDRSRGEGRKLTCTACHDPHQPTFQPMEPAPAPYVQQMFEH
jgi:hypothetical protein